MKWDIQQQMRKEFSGLSETQAREIQMRQVMEDPILGPMCLDLIAKQDTRPE
jgi:hypothetical protein